MFSILLRTRMPLRVLYLNPRSHSPLVHRDAGPNGNNSPSQDLHPEFRRFLSREISRTADSSAGMNLYPLGVLRLGVHKSLSGCATQRAGPSIGS
jgi:hypothetical protein